MTNRPGYRYDAPHQTTPAPVAAPQKLPTTAGSATGEDSEPRTPRRKKPRRPRLAEASQGDLPSTTPRHEELVRKAVDQPPPPSTNWTTLAGQLCAYGGVGLLTCGTVLVLSGYFGGPANYAPTGWLVAAVGQMLLFLGVVTLVSGGMEQTVDEVAWRVDQLGDRIIRLEQLLREREARDQRARRQLLRPQPDDRADAA